MNQHLFQKLHELQISYKTYSHKAVFTVQEALEIASSIPGANCKNLFLKDSKNRYWLVIALHDTKINLKVVAKRLEAPELRFANAELLQKYLGVEPGSVTPFGLINNDQKNVIVVVDKRIYTCELVGFHPLRNDATTVISAVDLEKFINSCGNTIVLHEFEL